MDKKFLMYGVSVIVVLLLAFAVFAWSDVTISQLITPASNNTYITNITGTDFIYSFNISLAGFNVSTATCFVEYNSNTTNFTMANTSYSATDMYWYYSLVGIQESTYNQWQNVTYKCNNTDNSPGRNDWNYTEFYQFRFDNTTPTTEHFWRNDNATLVGGGYNYTWNFTDVNKAFAYLLSCKLSASTSTSCSIFSGIESATITDTAVAGLANYTLTQSKLADIWTADGTYQFQMYVADQVSKTAHTNVTSQISKCKANQWCMLSYENQEGMLTGTFAGNYTTVTTVATWSNTNKAYTTYSTSAPTVNNATAISQTVPFLIYTTSDFYWVQNQTTLASITNTGLFELNSSASGLPNWNMIPLYNDTNMNYTLYGNTTSAYENAINEICYYNQSAARYQCCRKGIYYCSGPIANTRPDDINIARSSVVWANTNGTNVYLNTSVLVI